MEIIWSDDAKYDYEENIDYLLSESSEESAINFIDEVELVLDLIKKNPKLYPRRDYMSIRRAVVVKQITLFYQIKKSTIYLVRFWNNYKKPKSFL